MTKAQTIGIMAAILCSRDTSPSMASPEAAIDDAFGMLEDIEKHIGKEPETELKAAAEDVLEGICDGPGECATPQHLRLWRALGRLQQA